MHEALKTTTIETIDRDPFEIERSLAQHLLETRGDLLRALLRLNVGIGPQLQIDAPHIVGLTVHQCGLAGMKRRVEPEPPLGRKIGGHLDVGNQEFFFEGEA